MTKEEILPYADLLEAYVDKFTTPLSYDKGGDNGVLCGTGAYVGRGNHVYLITCAHIISELEKISKEKGCLIYPQCLFEYGEEYVPIVNPFKKLDDAIDVAMADITEVWNVQKINGKRTIPIEKFKTTPKIEGEYFYIAGYPSFDSKMEGDTLNSPIQKYLTTEGVLPNLADKELLPYYHFALKYSPEDCYYTRSEMHLCHDPRGLSGSLVWNTHLTDDIIKKKNKWNPDLMTVAGVEFLWDEGKSLVCSKSEAINWGALIDF